MNILKNVLDRTHPQKHPNARRSVAFRLPPQKNIYNRYPQKAGELKIRRDQ